MIVSVTQKICCTLGAHELVVINTKHHGARYCKHCPYTEYMFLDGWHKVKRDAEVECKIKNINKMEELKQQIKCPLCGKDMPLLKRNDELVIKGVTKQVEFLYYRCDECKEEFTTTESDEIVLQNALK